MSPEIIAETVAGISALSEIVREAIMWNRQKDDGRLLQRDLQQQQRQEQQQQQQPQNEQERREKYETVYVLAVIDDDLLAVMLDNIERVKKRLLKALADHSNTNQAKDAEVLAAKFAICSELRRISSLNQSELPTGPLKRLWTSHGCE